MLNPRLVFNQGLDQCDIDRLEKLHEARENMFQDMETLDPENADHLIKLRTYVVLLDALEFEMQRAWKFDQDPSKHTWWYQAPHCECPKMDNADPLMGFGGRIINNNCPLHGS